MKKVILTCSLFVAVIGFMFIGISCSEDNENSVEMLKKDLSSTQEIVYLGKYEYTERFVKDSVVYEVTIVVSQFWDTDDKAYFELNYRSVVKVGDELRMVRLYNADDEDNPYTGYVTIVDARNSECYVKKTVEDFISALVEIREDEERM